MAQHKVPLSAATKAALAAADNEAAALNHDYIAPEHLLLGLVRTSDQVLHDILYALNVTPEVIISRVTQSVKAATKRRVKSRRRPATNWADSTIKSAQTIAFSAGDSIVQPEHVLAALVMNQRGVAYGVLHDLGVTPQSVFNCAKHFRRDVK